VSGFGQYHSDKHPTNPQDYTSITLADIKDMLANPQQVDKADAQWFIPSTTLSRAKDEQIEYGQYYALWADIDEPNGKTVVSYVEGLASLFECEVWGYSSRSATEDNQKSRLMIPLAQPLTATDFVLYQTALNDLFAAYDVTPDRATQGVNQICYLPNKGDFYHHFISEGERLILPHNYLDIAAVTQQQVQKKEAVQTNLEASKALAQQRISSNQLSPITAFNEAYELTDLLEHYGYLQCGKKWLSPNSESGAAGVTVNASRWISSHGSDVVAGIGRVSASGDSCSGDAFDLYCYYEHDNDRSAALAQLGSYFTTQDGLTLTESNQRNYMKENEVVLPSFSLAKNGVIFLPYKPLSVAAINVAPYPTAALGALLENACLKLASTIQAPIPMIANSLLAAASLVAQPFANVTLLHGRSVPISNFFVSIGDSGERKSAVDAYATKPITQHQSMLQQQYIAEFIDYTDELEVYEAARRNAKKGKTRAIIAAQLAAVGEPPVKPLGYLIVCSDPTVEGIYRQLNEGQSSIGIFSDEGGLLLGGYGMSEANKLATLARLSKLWDGAPFDRVRSGDGIGLLEHRRMSLHLMMQSVVADELLSDEVANGQGFLPRCWVTYPESTAGTRFFVDENPEDSAEIKAYYDRLTSLLEAEKPVYKADKQQLCPSVLMLTPTAKQLLIGFHDAVEVQTARGGRYGLIKGFANKAAEHCARMAGVLTIIEQGSDAVKNRVMIDDVMMHNAITLTQWYLDHLLSIYQRSKASEAVQLALLLIEDLNKLQAHSLPFFYKQPIQNKGHNKLRKKEALDAAIQTLIDYGHCRLVGKRMVDNAIRQEVYELRDMSCDSCDSCDSNLQTEEEEDEESQQSQQSQDLVSA
jgi:hypothetical protein